MDPISHPLLPISEDEPETELPMEESQCVDEPLKKKPKALTSDVWKSFTKLVVDEVKKQSVMLETLGFCYERVYPSCWQKKLENIKTKLYMLFSKYSSSTSSSTFDVGDNSSRSVLSTEAYTFNASLFDELQMRKHLASTRNGRSQLDTYLEEVSLDIGLMEHMDV